MKAVVQRVSSSQVSVGKKVIAKINAGLNILLGIELGDDGSTAEKMADKIANLRIFSDQAGKMNLSVKEVGGQILVVSQFTLCADTSTGRRPSFINAALPQDALPIYEKFISYLRDMGFAVETGEFGGMMSVQIVNDGPVTIILDTKSF